MITSVVNGDFEVYALVAAEDTAHLGFADTCVDSGDIFLRDRSADGLVLKDVSRTRLEGFHIDLAVTILTFTAGLTNVLAFDVDLFADSLAVRNPAAYLR